MTGTFAARKRFTIPRIDEASPPGVSSTSTIAAISSSSARSTAFSTYSCVTGLMSLSRWTASTLLAAVLRETVRAGHERSESEQQRQEIPANCGLAPV